MKCLEIQLFDKSITTDPKGVAVVKTKNEHSCGKEPDPRENESRLLRVRVRNKSGDVTKRPAAVIRNELRDMNENNLHNRFEKCLPSFV